MSRIGSSGSRGSSARDLAMAIALFEYNVAAYPDSANVYDSLGDAFEATGQLERAEKSYRRAVTLGQKGDDPNTPIYNQNLGWVVEKLAQTDG